MAYFDNSVLQKLCFRTLRKSYPKSEHQEGKREGSLEAALSRTRSARIPTVMLFFLLSQVSHEDENSRKKAEKFTGESDEKRVFPCCVLRVSRN